MFNAFIEILKGQLCHCVTNYKYYLKLFVLAPLLIALTYAMFALLAYCFPSILNSLILPNYGLVVIVLYFTFFYVGKLYVHAIRFVCLDEKPEKIFNLKYAKLGFLNGSYMLLISLYGLILFLLLLSITSIFLPIDQAYVQPVFGQQSEISNAVMNSLDKVGFHAQPTTSSYSLYIDYFLYFLSISLAISLLIFNVMAVSNDIEIPFYRSMFQLKGFMGVNFLIAFISLIIQTLPMHLSTAIIAYSPNALGYSSAVFVSFLVYLVNIFLMLCHARNFKLWRQATK